MDDLTITWVTLGGVALAILGAGYIIVKIVQLRKMLNELLPKTRILEGLKEQEPRCKAYDKDRETDKPHEHTVAAHVHQAPPAEVAETEKKVHAADDISDQSSGQHSTTGSCRRPSNSKKGEEKRGELVR